MKKFAKNFLFFLITIFLIIGSFKAGIYYNDLKQEKPKERVLIVENKESGKPTNVDFGLFWEVWQKLEEKHIKREDLNRDKMVEGAIAGLIKSLDDPYTVFMTPKESKRFQDDVQGSFSGIGAEIGIRKGSLLIITPLKDTPAEKAGLLAGDKILKINNEDTIDMALDEAVSRIRGERGTEVNLLIARKDHETKEYKITRDNIKIPVIKFEKLENGLFYIALYNFSANASSEFNKAIGEFISSGSDKIILDLRNNPGGFLETSVGIAGWFIERGKTVVTEDFGGKNTQSLHSRGPAKLQKTPMIVLINQGTASASEILAGALRDINGIKLIGEKSFGKGSVQEIDNLSKEGATLKITIARWLTPSGRSIMDDGLEPDIKIERKAEDIEQDKDPQLDKAKEILKSL
ncbi:MAG: S41 family peptidase [Parcubacteria group bacterium]|nr:S41 family peptidase [Parcubacteria group bacterium]